MKKLQQLSVIFFIATFLIACSSRDEFAELRRYVDKVMQRPPRPIEKLPVYKDYPPYKYNAAKLRSPFVSKIVRKKTNVEGPDMDRQREVLEGYPLDAIKMVGLLAQGSRVWALLRDPKGVVHRVHEGSYIGKNFGRVTNISHDRIDILESIRDKYGEWKVRNNHLRLNKR